MDFLVLLLAIPISALACIGFGWLFWFLSSFIVGEDIGFFIGVVFAILAFLSGWLEYFGIPFIPL
tara:strand:+ start:535 stop:729 length:195 start_codon:yes stop_codon:yes gene_type:complete